MQKKQSISAPKKGMNKDTHPSQLQNIEYIHAENVNIEFETGDNLNIITEPSNNLSVNFPNGYKVIGFKKDILNEKTYYFLTNPETKKSSIGYVVDKKLEVYNSDEFQDCGDCNGNNVIPDYTEPSADNTYIELLNDVCHSVGEGLNFDINFPIKFVEIKNEKLSSTLYWNDYNNPPRYLVVSDISYLYNIEVPCGEDIPTECIIIDKLLQFPKHTSIKINPELIQTGGNLKQGTYEFYGAYCDIKGNELTNYSTATNPISIFDINDNILSQQTLDKFTNYSIKLDIKDLDRSFKYYKIVCIERNNVNNSQSAFLAGIFPTTDNVVSYTSSGSINDDGTIATGNSSVKVRVEPYTLFLDRTPIEKAKGDKVIAGRKYIFGLKQREELNLQPVVNLFGSLLKFQTSVAREDLYASSIATSKFKGYTRDEVYPFGIRFLYKDGAKTAVFPLIGRPSTPTDLEVISDDNFSSLSDNSPNCSNTLRNKRWQIFNTAVVEDYCSNPTEDSIEVQEDLQRSCIINNVNEIGENTISLEIDESYSDLKTFIEENYEYVTDPANTEVYNAIGQYLLDTYPSDNCAPIFPNDCESPTLVSERNEIEAVYLLVDEIVSGKTYLIDVLQAGDDFSNIGFVAEGEEFVATGNTPTSWTNGTEVFKKDEESSILVEKDIADYILSKPPSFCQVYDLDEDTGKKYKDTVFQTNYLPCSSTVYARQTPSNNDCNYAQSVLNNNDTNTSGVGYYTEYQGDFILANLLTTKDAFVTGANFNAKLHNKAIWFKVEKSGRDNLIFEITKNSACKTSETVIGTVDKLRYTFYASCSSTTPIGGDIVDTNVGTIENIDVSTFPNTFYVAIDSPIVQSTSTVEACDECILSECTDVTTYIIAPPCGCFSVFTRDVEYESVTVSWDKIIINKIQTYESNCTFFIPNVDECDPKPYSNGSFSYWESTEEYPDNPELFDSSGLVISENILNTLTASDKTKFENYYTESVDLEGNYVLKPTTDFRCSKIRHFKMPDNKVAPFMSSFGSAPLSEALIYPLGVSIDENVIVAMLNVALDNNLITQSQLDNIEGFEILRGDNSVQKSVIANGLAYDMYKYSEKGNDVLYANYPHNDLGDDILHYNSSSRNKLIPHPNSGNGNNNFSVISPDLLLTNPQIPSEVVMSGFQLGSSLMRFTDVEEHPKWTILGRNARTIATTLAVAEFALEIIIRTVEFSTQSGIGNLWFVGGVSTGSNVAGAGASAGQIALFTTASALQGFPKLGQYRYQWLKTFRDLGTSYNFASYAVSTGHHNLFLPNSSENDYVRALSVKRHMRDGRYNFRDKTTGEKLLVNNKLREYSTFISTGNFPLTYINEYKTYDNNRISTEQGSRTILSQNDCESNVDNLRNVGSPYVTLRNYIPDQFGTINSIKWLTTNYIFKIGEQTACKTIFGGNMFISRFSWKRKLPLFTTTAMGLPDKLAFEYSKYRNIGYPKFYCDYETDTEYTGFLLPFPDIDSNFTFDCQTGSGGFYVKPPSKLYLYYYGITDFLVESEINCNYRFGKVEPKDNFYPNVGDVIEWTQQKNTPIKEPNTFYYNNVYSLPVSNSSFRLLDVGYKKEDYRKLSIQDNAVMYSEEDNSENNMYLDPWLAYKPLNRYEFPTKYGKLQNIQNLQGEQVLGLFSDQAVVFNKVDNLADRITPQTSVTGTGGIFTTRPAEFSLTDLGFAGTQNTELANTPYGNFYVDAKRGKIYQIQPSGSGLEPISDFIQGKPSGMKNWFREHLPFKILKQLPDIDTDNKFKGIGFNIWYDARFDRVFFTKKDVVVKDGVNLNNFTIEDNKVLYNDVEVEFTDDNLFTDVSWTIAYSPSGGWISFYSFKPNYSVAHQDYFSTGININGTLWNHYLGNKSFQRFYGNQEKFLIEYPIQAENIRKQLSSISFYLEARRWQNQWDFAEHKGIGFDKVVIYNNTNNSGTLNLFEQKSQKQVKDFPKTNGNSQDILYTAEEGKHTINYFYNRVKEQNNNIPQWLWDRNMINKQINPQAISFTGKRLLERMRGDYFIVRLVNDSNSNFQLIFKNTIQEENGYN